MVPEKWYLIKKMVPEKLSLEKCPPKLVLRQKNARKFGRLFLFLSIDSGIHIFYHVICRAFTRIITVGKLILL